MLPYQGTSMTANYDTPSLICCCCAFTVTLYCINGNVTALFLFPAQSWYGEAIKFCSWGNVKVDPRTKNQPVNQTASRYRISKPSHRRTQKNTHRSAQVGKTLNNSKLILTDAVAGKQPTSNYQDADECTQ